MAPSRIDDHLRDAVVEQFRFEAERGRLTVTLWQKPEAPWKTDAAVRKQLVLSGIRNGAAVVAVQQLINTELRQHQRAELGYRVDWFGFDLTLPGQSLDLHLLLEIDHLPPLTICCAKYTLQVAE